MLAGNVLITGGAESSATPLRKMRTTPWSEDTWNDGNRDWSGRLRVYFPGHPRAKSTNFIFRAWAVWWIHTGADAPAGYDIHHRNDDHTDDRFENLKLLTHGDHIRHHQVKDPITLICTGCGEPFDMPQWRINEGRGKFCSLECYHSTPLSEEVIAKRAAASVAVRLANRLPLQHGTISMYRNNYCRCTDCKRANREWTRQYRLRRKVGAC